MKVYNTSRFKTTDLYPLIDFVTARCKAAYMAHLLVEEGPDHYRNWDGFSWQREGDDPTAPSRVKIWVGNTVYPNSTTYRKSVGAVTVRSWQEEFLHVLAHELRHIDQFWSTEVPVHYEVDAERFAVQVLEEWKRREQPQRRARARSQRSASISMAGSPQRRRPARAA